jgi:CelD/BcsL family acetyltransferase involved in cellulose biosynthesis
MNAGCGGARLRFESAARWADLRSEWMRLHAERDPATFFLSAGWMDAWLQVYADGLDPRLALFELGNELVGMALICARDVRRGPFVVRRVQLNTAGEGPDSPMLEHNSLLCRPALREAFAGALIRSLDEESWDEFEFSGVGELEWSVLALHCRTPAALEWRDAPYVDLARLRADGGSYLDSLSRNTRHQVRRSMTLYEQRGGLRLERADGKDQALRWFAELVDLHEALWSARGKPGAFASPRQREFHERIIAAGVASGAARIIRIRAGQDTIGVLYNLVDRGHVSYYQSGFRYETDNRLKPGLVCHALAIQDALDSGCREYDFLAAANDGARYKVSLANANRRFGWATLRRDSLKLRAIDALSEARRRWRKR